MVDIPVLGFMTITAVTNTIVTAVTVVFILIATVIIARLSESLVDRIFGKPSEMLRVDSTQYNFSKHLVKGLIYALGIAAAVYSIPSLRAISYSVLAGAGVLAVAIGFASQQAFSNIVGGVFITLFQPFRVGDRIQVGSNPTGIVEDINLRHTVIRTFENKRIMIPNSLISSEVIENANIEDEKICRFVEFPISYDSDIEKAMEIMREEAMNHPSSIDNRSDEEKRNKEPIVRIKVVGFGDSSVNLRAWVWAPDPLSAFYMGCDLNKSIKQRFDKQGIEIPFPYRTIVYKKDQ